ncbi:hypothetical protein WICMUC_000677 [Wickerhamomyces mucosus]|uniref:FHA domain-containing protein n=1 Tax=Wickerhamomyces mucosus TaxID=1378264 RepID=A0A9P8PZ71_9ASCO|nr:hypothetical protein WICMUC_000677 [Wickerhamomyces mucosus]
MSYRGFRPRSDDNVESYNKQNYNYREKTPSTAIVKKKPNFKPSGLLAKESNNFKGIQLKYNEPGDSPSDLSQLEHEYFLYSYKKHSNIPSEHALNGKKFHLLGRDDKVVDIWINEDSISKQHAVIQFRNIKTSVGEIEIKPYIIDLESSNGTFINDDEIPPSRYVELKDKDSITFGDSDIENIFIVI